MNPWLSIIGVGEEGLEGLPPVTRRIIERAEILVGGERHLAMVPNGSAQRLTWASPLSQTVEEIKRHRGRNVVVLATGDPMWFGIGATLVRHIAAGEMLVIPGISAFTLAASRLCWPLADVECLTLHGRALALMRSAIAPGAKLLLLANDGATPIAVAKLLVELGYGPSRITVLEHMGAPQERQIAGAAQDWSTEKVEDFNTIAVDCNAGLHAVAHSRLAGLPDEAFDHDGQLTKQEVRAATLAALAPLPGQLLWDVGAGCGSISIEWLRAGRRMRAVAIERNPTRREMMNRNCLNLGTPALEVVDGEAPAVLGGLPAPDAVFIGGGLSGQGLAEVCWEALKPGGRLVANAVTVEGEAALFAARARWGGDLTRIAISRADVIGPHLGWRPLMPVTQYAAVKPRGHP
ncbi:MAG: precorrin-6y C5,15-methyltransferase (decarboxylating) subunit CbiE [Dongiaceae bacterium]